MERSQMTSFEIRGLQTPSVTFDGHPALNDATFHKSQKVSELTQHKGQITSITQCTNLVLVVFRIMNISYT